MKYALRWATATASPRVRAPTGPSRVSRGRSQSPANQASTSASRVGSASSSSARTRVGTSGASTQVLGGCGAVAQVFLVKSAQHRLDRLVDDFVRGVAGQRVLAAQGAGTVRVGTPAHLGVLVVRDLDVDQVLALSQQRRASLGFVAGQPGRDEVEPCVGNADAAAGGDVQDNTRGFCAVANDDNAGGGAARVLVDEAQQL